MAQRYAASQQQDYQKQHGPGRRHAHQVIDDMTAPVAPHNGEYLDCAVVVGALL